MVKDTSNVVGAGKSDSQKSNPEGLDYISDTFGDTKSMKNWVKEFWEVDGCTKLTSLSSIIWITNSLFKTYQPSAL